MVPGISEVVWGWWKGLLESGIGWKLISNSLCVLWDITLLRTAMEAQAYLGCSSQGRIGHSAGYSDEDADQYQFNSNSIQNKSPALQVLCLVVSVMQSFKTTTCSPRFKKKIHTQELGFKVAAT